MPGKESHLLNLPFLVSLLVFRGPTQLFRLMWQRNFTLQLRSGWWEFWKIRRLVFETWCPFVFLREKRVELLKKVVSTKNSGGAISFLQFMSLPGFFFFTLCQSFASPKKTGFPNTEPTWGCVWPDPQITYPSKTVHLNQVWMED